MNSILVVDDQESNISVLQKILSPEYNIYSALSGEDAIDAAQKYLPDVILLDILLIDMDGYSVFAALKKMEKTRDIPVIFVTSLSSEEDEARGLALGAADYITKPFTPGIVKLRVRNQIRLVEQLRTIEKLSMVDQLTELPNRRNLEEKINAEWNRAIRDKKAISILVIDIDLFKTYNDTFGHQQGDAALKATGKVLAASLKRPGDFAARWGGEEFVVLLPNTDLFGAIEISEKIRKNIEEIEIPCVDSAAAKITVSIGINTQLSGKSGSVCDFISGADTALYDAKNKGRNTICYFGENTDSHNAIQSIDL